MPPMYTLIINFYWGCVWGEGSSTSFSTTSSQPLSHVLHVVERRNTARMKIGHRLNHYGGNTVMVLASVAAVATAAGAVWGLQRADSGLANIESTTQDVATDLLSVSRGRGDAATARLLP